MQVLDISAELGPGTRPVNLEVLVRGIRVTSDVAHDAESRRVRRGVSERMKYPTDTELRSALDRLPGGDEQSPRYRAERQLAARDYLSSEGRRFPPDMWFEYFYRRNQRDLEFSSSFRALSDAGYDRLIGTSFPFFGGVGLEVLDPILYDALVADELARSLPEELGIRTLRYENPFLAALFGKGRAEKTVSTAVEVIEVAREFGPKRTIAKAEAAVAEATVENRITESDLDVALKREQLIETRLRNERRALENAHLEQALDADQQRRMLIDRAIRRGQIDIADALRALNPGDAEALGELGRRQLEVETRWEPDDGSE
jgi:hypothetical protein